MIGFDQLHGAWPYQVATGAHAHALLDRIEAGEEFTPRSADEFEQQLMDAEPAEAQS